MERALQRFIVRKLEQPGEQQSRRENVSLRTLVRTASVRADDPWILKFLKI